MKLKIADKIRDLKDAAHAPVHFGGRTISLMYPCVLAGVFFFSLCVAYLVCMAAGSALSARLFPLHIDLANALSARSNSAFMSKSTALTTAIDLDPFGASIKGAEQDTAGTHSDAVPIDAFQLIGTIRPVAAWVMKDGQASLVLKDQEYNGYTLAEVNAGNVVFTLGENKYILYLYYSAVPQTKPQQAPQPTQTDAGQKRSDIQNAEFNGKDGVITRELMHNLLMNPYDELGKLRLVPTQSGMIVQSMRPDSLLNQLGVRRGDEIKGVNGISIKDVPSIMNAINSMMSGTRLDFDISRNNQQGKLGYVVK